MSPFQIVLSVLGGIAALVALFTVVMAAMSATGRDQLAVIGVRVADALVRFFERRLTEQSATTRSVSKHQVWW